MQKEDLFKLIDYAYCAGIIDGEGCISIREIRHNNFCLDLQVEMSNKEVLYFLRETFGGNIYKRRKIRSNKQMFIWKISGDDVKNVLKIVLPFLIEKKRKAEIAIEFRNYVDKTQYKGGGQRLSEEIIIRRKKFCNAMREGRI